MPDYEDRWQSIAAVRAAQEAEKRTALAATKAAPDQDEIAAFLAKQKQPQASPDLRDLAASPPAAREEPLRPAGQGDDEFAAYMATTGRPPGSATPMKVLASGMTDIVVGLAGMLMPVWVGGALAAICYGVDALTRRRQQQ